MEQIIIQVKNKRKARALFNFLASLDFVEAVSSADLPKVESSEQTRTEDFFALAGLWAGRDVTLETIREKAWPQRL
ncbi:MAG: hypothetical protein WA821_00220 [Anaerolineales bacterium]|jgi:hypothetical protein